MNRFVIVAAVGIVAATSQYGAEVRHLTLTEAVHLAISQNRVFEDCAAEGHGKRTEESRPAFRRISHLSRTNPISCTLPICRISASRPARSELPEDRRYLRRTGCLGKGKRHCIRAARSFRSRLRS